MTSKTTEPLIDWMWCYEHPKEAAAEIDRLRGQIRSLRSVVVSAIEWDGEDSEGVPAVWIETAELALKETA